MITLIVGMILLPFCVFFCVKLGTYGYLSSRRRFNRRYKDN